MQQMGNSPADLAPSVSYMTALASIKLVRQCSVLDLTEDDYSFLTGNALWLPADRSRARRCVEAAVYGALDYIGFPRFPAPVEFISAVIALYVNPVNVMIACSIMEGAEFSEHIINGIDRPVKPSELFAHTLRVLAGEEFLVYAREGQLRNDIQLRG